jgi:hypothetical protein
MVLSFVLPSGTILRSVQLSKAACAVSLELLSRFINHSRSSEDAQTEEAFNDCTMFDHYILPFLACPALANLATEVLYQNNTIDVLPQNLCLPPPAVRRHIRKIELSLQVHDENFSRLAKLFNGNLTLSGPELVQVHTTYQPGFNKQLELSMMSGLDTIRVPTKQLRVSLRQYTACCPFDSTEPSKQEVAAILLPKFTVEVNEGREAKECYELSHVHDDKGDEQRELDYIFSLGWPGERECCRTSRKTVWI